MTILSIIYILFPVLGSLSHFRLPLVALSRYYPPLARRSTRAYFPRLLKNSQTSKLWIEKVEWPNSVFAGSSRVHFLVAGGFRKVTKLVLVPWERQDPDSEYKPRRPRPTPHMAEFIDTS